jgi:hypothetical protein
MMTIEQLNEWINRGYIGAGLLAIAFAILIVSRHISPKKHR